MAALVISNTGWVMTIPARPIRARGRLGNAYVFVGLHAEAPAGVCEARGHGGPRRGLAIRTVLGLDQETLEIQRLEASRIDPGLRIDQLQLLPRQLRQS